MKKGTDLLSEIEVESARGSRGPRGWDNSFGARAHGLRRTRSDTTGFFIVFGDLENVEHIRTCQTISESDKMDNDGNFQLVRVGASRRGFDTGARRDEQGETLSSQIGHLGPKHETLQGENLSQSRNASEEHPKNKDNHTMKDHIVVDYEFGNHYVSPSSKGEPEQADESEFKGSRGKGKATCEDDHVMNGHDVNDHATRNHDVSQNHRRD